MAKIKMSRVDYRMVHGQIVAKWIKFRPVDRLILVDDLLVDDEFMADIYRMAVPDRPVDICKMADVQNTLDKTDDFVMLIFKDVSSAYAAVQAGLKLTELNVGALQNKADRKSVIQGVSLSPEEYNLLTELKDQGVDVYLQPIPENDPVFSPIPHSNRKDNRAGFPMSSKVPFVASIIMPYDLRIVFLVRTGINFNFCA